jgi:hypothetical protein
VKLINTDGMALIGPGSEWFWTALSGLVLAVTFIAIWRQLSMARSASAREQLDAFSGEWNSERLMRHRLALFVARRDGADPAHLPEGAAVAVAEFWERIGQLVRSGHHDRKVVHAGYGSSCQLSWAILAAKVREWRVEEGVPTEFEHFEWLAGLMDKMDRRTGAVLPVLDEAWFATTLEGRITYCEEVIRVEQALRTVIVASPDATSVAQPPASPTPEPTQA